MPFKPMIAGVIVCAALVPVTAGAVTKENFLVRTAEDLVALCSAEPSPGIGEAAVNFCDGYAQGAVSVELERENANPPRRICFPNPTPPRRTTLDEFVRWARANPARLGEPPNRALFSFLAERFPCTGRRSGSQF